jgi:formyl-CoA transferase
MSQSPDVAQGPQGPLIGLKVVEFAQVIAGPLAGGLLADMGADVVHVEPPGLGDAARRIGPRKDGTYVWWKVSGRNKRSVCCDLRHERGQALAARLVEWADVVIVTFRASTLRDWGLDWESIHARNPRAVVLQISGYGANTSRADDPGFGKMGEARSGVVHLTGMTGGPPVHTAFSHGDATTGLMGSWAVLAALWRRERDPDFGGEWIDLALYESLYRLIEWQVIVYDQLEHVVSRQGNRMEFSPGAVQNTYETAEGVWLTVTSATAKSVQKIAVLLGLPGDEFETQEQQAARRDELDEKVAAWVRARPTDAAIAAFEQAGIVVSTIMSAADIVSDPIYAERADIIEIEDHDLGRVKMQAALPHLRQRPGAVWRTGPMLGEDNDLVYGDWLGLSESELDDLRRERVI